MIFIANCCLGHFLICLKIILFVLAGTIHMYTICRHLMTVGQSAKVWQDKLIELMSSLFYFYIFFSHVNDCSKLMVLGMMQTMI